MRVSLGSVVFLVLIYSVFGSVCPDGEITVKKFRVFEEQLNWFAALLNCSSQGMTLATIESQEEKNQLLDQLEIIREKDSPVMSWWIGAADLHQDEFLWFSTGEPIKYENFHSGQPSSSYMSDKENCVEILFARGWDYEWNDTKCSNNQRFICEYFERKNS